jgi:DNA-binding NtrC family response regulator
MAQINIFKGKKKIETVPLFAEVTTIGRLELDSDYRPDIALSDRSVSKFQAAIVQNQSGSYFIRDLGSLNLTRVNQKPVFRKLLEEGDRIEIGKFSLIYTEVAAEAFVESPIQALEDSETGILTGKGKPTINLRFTNEDRLKLTDKMQEVFNEIVTQIELFFGRETVLSKVINMIATHLNVESGFVAVKGEDGQFSRIHTFGINRDKGEKVRYSRNVVDIMLVKDQPILTSSVPGSSTICGPLYKGAGESVIIYLVRAMGDPFLDKDLDFVTLLCEHLGPLLEKNCFCDLPVEQGGSESGNFQWKTTFVGNSRSFREVLRKLDRLAHSDINVLIVGETGTGKEIAAKMIHERSKRKDGPFIPVELPKFNPDLVGDELFGHVKGAFTSATQDRKGCFELAEGGTLFLDEIGDIKLDVQAKLRRALEQKEIARFGQEQYRKVNVRVISATNADLEKAKRTGRFREDLFQRLVAVVKLSPLRERKEDIPLLVHFFIDQSDSKLRSVSHAAMKVLLQYPWPGNVRELKNLIEVFAAEDKEMVTSTDLPSSMTNQAEDEDVVSLHDETRNLEKEKILKALTIENWNVTRTAKRLGISKQTLYNRIEQYKLSRPEKSK